MSGRRRGSRIGLRGSRWYGDFREFADVGGGIEALKPPNHHYGTTDRDIAAKLASDRVAELEQLRRNKYLLGRDKTSNLKDYAAHHLRVKARTGRVRYETVAANEQQLRTFVAFIGADRPLESITTDDIQRFDSHLASQPGTRGRTLSGQSRRHYLNAVSNLYRRAQSEGYVPPGYNPVAAMMDKPTGRRVEARWLEVHEAALLLEAARVYEAKREDLAIPFMHNIIAALLLTGGRWREVAGLLVSDVSFERGIITFRPHEHRRLKTQTSSRTVPLHPQLRDILEGYLRAYSRIGGLLFPSPRTGRMITDIRKQLDSIAEAAGWQSGEIRTKVFRHTYCAARLQTLDQGHPISVYTVARELGHGGDALIKRVYGHLGQVRHRSEHVEYRIEQHEHRDEIRDRLVVLRSA